MNPGDRFERYTIENVLGRGGMGCVYKAHDPKLGRDVAIKVLLATNGEGAPAEEAKARILREARAAAALSHPNAISIFDVGENDAVGPFIVMELVEGRSFRDAVSDPTATLKSKLRWLTEAASALAAAHDRGIIHRDVKPENVLVRTDGVAKVLDFGIARRSSTPADPSAPTQAPLPTLTEHGAQIGTPLYMAPEQVKGDPLDGRSDQFAWGVLAYEALAGKLPWKLDKGPLGVAASILTDTPAPLVDVPPEIEAVVRRALSKDPADRYASMHELMAELGGSASERASSARVSESAAPKSAPANAGRTSGPASAPASGPSSRSSKPSVDDARRYDTQQFKEIFQRALERQEQEGKYGRDDLVAAAREMGIRDDVLAQTLAAEDEAEAAEQRAIASAAPAPDRGREVRKLMRSAVTFGIVNVVYYLLLQKHSMWVLYGTLIALAFQLRNVWFPKDHDGRESRRDRRRRRREERREERSRPGRAVDESDARIEEGVRILLSTTAKKPSRVRIATPAASGTSEARESTAARESNAAAEAEDDAEADVEADAGSGRNRARR